MATDPSECLGVDATTYRFENVHLSFELIFKLVSQASNRLLLVSPTLDAQLYGRQAIADQLSRLARRHRTAEIRILVADVKPLVGTAHPVLELCRRLPSKIRLRALNPAYPNTSASWLLADNAGIHYCKDPQLQQGFVNFSDPALVKRFSEEFEAMWQRALESPELRQLNL